MNQETALVPADVALLDLLRKRESMSVAEFGELLGVTATAVRQRLTRLMAQGYVDRQVVRAGRGRPSHQYVLTKAGRRQSGSNFADLAIALWQEIRAIEDPEVRRGLIQRVSRRLADLYAGQIEGETLIERMESLAELFADKQIPFEVGHEEGLPVLRALSCPYPELAEQDRAICAMERVLFAEMLDAPLRLSGCRLDGEKYCTFSGGRGGIDADEKVV